MTSKILAKHGVLTSGSGNERVVLDYESGLVYGYHNPEKITGIFEPKLGWVITREPYYSTGGWGSGSSGDREGSRYISFTKDLLRAINATVLELNVKDWITQQQIDEHNKAVEKLKKSSVKSKLLTNITEDLGEIALPKKIEFSRESKGESLRGIDPIKEYEKYMSGLEVFLKGKGKKTKIESFVFDKNLVVQVNYGNKIVVAFRDAEGQVFLNSQVIQISHFEEKFLGKQSLVQKKIREIAKYSIPFNVLESAKLKLSETKVIEQGNEYDVVIKSRYREDETRHFTGALLLENSGRKFLMDLDQVEVKNHLFNVFFVEVNGSVNSIAEAYESMKPQEVKDAEKSGIKVLRQGEWFFIETDKTIETEHVVNYNWDEDIVNGRPHIKKQAVSHGKGRPNNLFMPFNFPNQKELEGLVCGTVSHQGREHGDLDLGSEVLNQDTGLAKYRLWKLIGNTTIGNFTINGDVD